MQSVCTEAIRKYPNNGLTHFAREDTPGVSKKDVLERAVSGDLERICEERRTKVCETGEVLHALAGADYEICVSVPIISAGDITGSFYLI